MPKLTGPSMQFTVSFNGAFGGKEYGDADMHTADFEGDCEELLAQEVIEDSPSFPLTFRKNENTNSDVVGWFSSVEANAADEYDVAVMVITSMHFG